jgi:hypothetical protein
MEDAVADGVGECGIAQVGVPVGEGELACEDSRAQLVTILKQLEQIGALGVGDGGQGEVIEHEDIEARELCEQTSVAAVEAREPELFEQARGAAR